MERLGLDDITLVVHDFGGPIGLPLALRAAEFARQSRRVVMMNTWAWPLDDDPKMARGARFIGGAIGRFLYRYANASLRLIMPSAYGDRKKLTPEIHRRTSKCSAIATRACSCCTRWRSRCSDRARIISRCSIASIDCGRCRS